MDLPDGDGYALLQQLHSRAGLGRLPAIAVSGYSRAQWRSRATGLGFDHYAVKPFAIASLVSEIVSLKGGAADGGNATV